MPSEQINEAALHELAVIDSIVRGGGEARPEDAALTDFALLVRNARPLPGHGEAEALNQRVAKVTAPRKPGQGFVFKPVVAGVLALVVLAGATATVVLSSSSRDDTVTALSTGGASPPSADSASSAAEALSVAPRTPGGVKSAKVPREVARDTRLTLAADGADIERLSDRVNAIVDQYGGYVASSKVRGGEGSRGRATFALMIPAAQYRPALASISKLAHVRSRSQSSQDITTEVNSAEREVKRWTSRVQRLDDQLAAAQSVQQRASLSRQLASAKSALREATRQVRANRARVNYVPIALTIVADKSAAEQDSGTIAKAFDKAGTILTSIAAALIVSLAVLIPLALILAAVWFGTRRWKRVRSDQAIDAAAVPQSE